MSLMSRKVDYALLILAYLDQHPEGGCAREIADAYGLNKGFAANILKELCRKGFVVSHRGVKGGYALHRPADEVNLAELMDALEEAFHLAECSQSPASEHCSLTAVCPVKGAIAEVHARIRDVLRGVTLAEVFRPRGTPPPILMGLNLVPAEKLLAGQ
jgi:Rrf2 family transcriptional regulator, cysteine metabolism repressor